VHKTLRRGEWNRVVASTYKDHTVVCGMGELGSALCEGLVEAGQRAVAVDVDEDTPGMVAARQRGVPTVVGDMALPDTLRAANVQRARVVVLCSGNDLTNLEAAIEAQRANPHARVYARVYKESFACTVKEALGQDINLFSPYATAAHAILAEMNDAEQPEPAQQSTPR
jgi:voltage-gated potassium channel